MPKRAVDPCPRELFKLMQDHDFTEGNDWSKWAEFYDILYANGSPDIAFYIEEINRVGRSVLELGCGTGRVTIALAKHGFDVTGIDNSPDMLRELRKNREQAGSLRGPLRLVQGDMRDFSLERKFDAVIIPARTFQLLLSPQEQRSCLRSIHNNLKIDGLLIFDTANEDGTIGVIQRGEQRNDSNSNSAHLNIISHKKIKGKGQIYETTVAISEHFSEGNEREPRQQSVFVHYIYPEQIRALFRFAGFDEETCYGEFDRSPFDARSKQMIWVARRKLTLRD